MPVVPAGCPLQLAFAPGSGRRLLGRARSLLDQTAPSTPYQITVTNEGPCAAYSAVCTVRLL